MGKGLSVPLDRECYDDPRGFAPIISLLAGATIHYFVGCIFLYWNNGKVGGIFKILLASFIFVCSWIQFIIDYSITADYHAYQQSSGGASAKERFLGYNCQIFIFSQSPNWIHFISWIFCGVTFDNLCHTKNAHSTRFWSILILSLSHLSAVATPNFGGIFSHLFVGSILYFWFTLIFLIISGVFFYKGFYAFSDSEIKSIADKKMMKHLVNTFNFHIANIIKSYLPEKSNHEYSHDANKVLVNVYVIIAMWCFILYYMCINNSMVQFYGGDNYIDSWLHAWHRQWTTYWQLLSHDDWMKAFLVCFMLI